MALVKKRLGVETWMFDQLQALYATPMCGGGVTESQPSVADKLRSLMADGSRVDAELSPTQSSASNEPIGDSAGARLRFTKVEANGGGRFSNHRDRRALPRKPPRTERDSENEDNEVDIDLDELLDMENDVVRKEFLLKTLHGAKKSRDIVEDFVEQLIILAKTL
ncbi:protein phosphatase 1 regulatory subunit 14B-like [Tropilaelaps mercedesae]|uniref:Protein phosphatase 1 regulatory subunit 14B-like n=1 Tax=Tropilaelaps mercedesae TaxID=418985 RepID=A0A1V9WZV4_9ACAR|nr:protein phosphatase 1 regulatory subunit 14B-like [Tropilaelaps mercedesae]